MNKFMPHHFIRLKVYKIGPEILQTQLQHYTFEETLHRATNLVERLHANYPESSSCTTISLL